MWPLRVVLWTALAVVAFRGITALISGPSPAPAGRTGPNAAGEFPVSLAEAYATEFGRVYLGFSPQSLGQREQALASFVPPAVSASNRVRKLIGEEPGLYLRKHVGGPVAARKLYDEAQLRLVTANDPVPPAGKVTMADQFGASIAGFSDWLPTAPGRRKGPSTCTRYITIVTRFAAWARGRGRGSFAEITKTDLRGWLSSLKDGQAAQATKAANWWPIRALYRYLSDEEGLPDISASITMHAEPVPDKITHLDSADVQLLLKACRDAREKAVISVFLDAGVRISEGHALRVTDVLVDDLRSRRLIVTGKGGKVRTVVIGTETAMALRRYLRDRAKSPHTGSGALWLGKRGPLTICGLDQLIRAIGRRAGLDIHPHLLRHTWAHHYRLNGGQTDNLVYLALAGTVPRWRSSTAGQRRPSAPKWRPAGCPSSTGCEATVPDASAPHEYIPSGPAGTAPSGRLSPASGAAGGLCCSPGGGRDRRVRPPGRHVAGSAGRHHVPHHRVAAVAVPCCRDSAQLGGAGTDRHRGRPPSPGRRVRGGVMTSARTRALASLPVVVVAVFAGIVSYSHIYALAVRTGQSGTAARLLPLSVDLLIVAGSVILLADSGRSRLGWLGVGPGVAATLFANIESGLGHGWLAAMVAAWPAHRVLAGQLHAGALAARTAAASRSQCPHTPASSADEAVIRAFPHGRDCAGHPPSQRQLSAAFGVSRSKVAALVGSLNGQQPQDAGETAPDE